MFTEPIAMKLDMLQWRLEYYNACINHDPVMTLTKFKARSTYVGHIMHNGVNMSLTGKTSGNEQMDRILIILKKEIDQRG